MKQLILNFAILVAIGTMAACGSKTAKGGDNDSTAQADSAVQTAAQTDLWTEEAVEAQIRKIYDRINEMNKQGSVDISQLEDEFCSSYFLDLRNAIAKHDEQAKGDMRFMGDEGYHWLLGLKLPMKIDKINCELLTEDQAGANVFFEGREEEDDRATNGYIHLLLWLEDGQWRINNFEEPEIYGPSGYLGKLEEYVRENDILTSHTEGAPLKDGQE